MALAAGAKKNKNGRRVYSQTANAIRKRQEAGSGEFSEDYAAAAETTQPPASENPQELPIPSGEFSTETIGVTTTATVVAPEVPLAPHTEDQPNYFCENCKNHGIRTMVSLMETECPTCEETFNWSGLT